MSDQENQPPLTRRERRLREQAATGALDLSEVIQQAKAPAESPVGDATVAETEAATGVPGGAEGAGAADAAAGEIEISPFNEDGTPRSRREMRQLREAALAAGTEAPETEHAAPAAEEASGVAAAAEAAQPVPEAPEIEADEVAADPVPVISEAAEEVATGPATEDVIMEGILETAKNASEAPATSALDFDSLMSPPTAPFSVEDIREAESVAGEAAAATGAPAVDALAAAEDQTTPVESDAAVDVAATESDAAADAAAAESDVVADAAAKPKRRFPWTRNKAETAAVTSDASAVEAPAEESVEAEAAAVVADVAEAADAEPVAEQEAVASIPVEAVPEAAEDLPAPVPSRRRESAVAVEPDAAPQPVDANDSQKYSFPDIQPPEEWRSVFDDPASRTVGGQGANGRGDFDDLISRAVAQEGAAGTSNTSALILPSMPADTGGLTGPLGATGELYITGSIELPRSLGETGGHSSLHDSLQMEPIVMPEGGATTETTEQGPMPVSAKHAVSARMPADLPVVAKPTKEKSKMPLVLGLSGGGLLVIVVGLGVWGATNGLFSG